MFGSLMMLASGVLASSPSSASESGTRWASVSRSGNWARIRAASEIALVSTSTPALPANASTTGRNECVASAGASSV